MKNQHRNRSPQANRQPKTTAYDSAIRMLTRRDHTEKELVYKLSRKKFDAADIENTVKRCRELGYVDDAKTATAMAKQMTARGNGPFKIRRALEQKGVDDAAIQRALTHCGSEDDQVESARNVMKRIRYRLYRESDFQKRRALAYRFLMGRGFSVDVVMRATADL